MSRIIAFAGSLRRDSTNKKMLAVAVRGAVETGSDVTTVDLRDYPLPVYDGDIEEAEGLPSNVLALQKMLIEADGLLIASPEYNSSLSGALKNMIDWTSRPHGDLKNTACYMDKTAVLMSASPGLLGGLRGLFDLRKILSMIGVVVLPAQLALGQSHSAFDESGEIIDKKMRARVEALGVTLADYLGTSLKT